MKLYKAVLLSLLGCGLASAQFTAYNGNCSKGNTTLKVQGYTTSTAAMGSFPLCSVRVFLSGTTTNATIYSDSVGTVLSNPFVANSDGSYQLFTGAGFYDLRISGGGLSAPYTISSQPIVSTNKVDGTMYGAAPGSADNVAAFNAGLAVAAGTTYTLPIGLYTSSPITVPANTKFECGFGTALRQKVNSAIGGSGFITLGAGSSITGCLIDANGINQSIGFDAHGILLASGSSGYDITQNLIQNVRGVAIIGKDIGNNGIIFKNTILNNCYGTYNSAGRRAVDLSVLTPGTIRNVKVIANTLDNTTCGSGVFSGDGIHINSVAAGANLTSILIDANIIITSGNAVAIDPLAIELFSPSTGGLITNSVISNNIITCLIASGSPQMNGISLGGGKQNSGSQGITQINITGNLETGCSQPLELLGSHVRVTANMFTRCGGVYINSDAMGPDGIIDMDITSNTFNLGVGVNGGAINVFGGATIGVAPVTGLTIDNNKFYAMGSLSYVEVSVQAAAMSKISISGNRGYGSTRYGIYIGGITTGTLSELTLDNNVLNCSLCGTSLGYGSAISWAGDNVTVRGNTIITNNVIASFAANIAGNMLTFSNNTTVNISGVASTPLNLTAGITNATVEFNHYYGLTNDEVFGGSTTFFSSITSSPLRLAKNICLQCRLFDTAVPLYIGATPPNNPFPTNEQMHVMGAGVAGITGVMSSRLGLGYDYNPQYGAYLGVSHTSGTVTGPTLWAHLGVLIGGADGPSVSVNGSGRALFGYPVANPSINDDGLNTIQVNGSAKATRYATIFNGVAFSATPIFDLAGGDQSFFLSGNVTSSTVINGIPGQMVNFQLCQDATGARTFVWPTNFRGTMTAGATASRCSWQTFKTPDGSTFFATTPGVINQ